MTLRPFLACLLLSSAALAYSGCGSDSVSTGPTGHSVELSLGDLPVAPTDTHYALWLSYPKARPAGKQSAPLQGEVEHAFVTRFDVAGGKAVFIDDTSGLESRLGQLRFVQHAVVSLEKDGEIGGEPNLILISGAITGTLNEGKGILALNGHYAWTDDIDKTQGAYVLASAAPNPAYRSSLYLMTGSGPDDLSPGLMNLPPPATGAGFALWVLKNNDTISLGHFMTSAGEDDLTPNEYSFPGGPVTVGGTPIDLTDGSAKAVVTLWSPNFQINAWLLQNLTLLSGDVPNGLTSFTPSLLSRRDLSRFRASVILKR